MAFVFLNADAHRHVASVQRVTTTKSPFQGNWQVTGRVPAYLSPRATCRRKLGNTYRQG